jgi:hypothetical protein
MPSSWIELIETLLGSGAVPGDIWQFVSDRVLIQAHRHFGKVGGLRYFIVENAVDGYVGVEGNPSTEEENGRRICRCHVMDVNDCKQVILERTECLQ